nr:hypothetical protein [Gemmatimonadales bacterium]
MTAPPGAVVLLIAYGAGLATGLARFQDPHHMMVVSLAAAALLRREILRVAAIAIAVGVVVGAASGRVRHDGCGETIRTGPLVLTVRLDEPAANGWIRATSIDAQCRGPVRVRWPAGQVAVSGAVVRVEGTGLTRKSAMAGPAMIVGSTVHLLPAPPRRLSDRIHDAVGARSAALFGRRAPLVDALV